jgi:protein-disulfide isomerase
LTKAFLVLFIMVTLGAASIALYFYSDNQKIKAAYLRMRLDPTYQQCKYYSEKQVQLDIRPDDHVLGSRNAPVQIVVYKDAQCEYCHKTWTILNDLYKKINAEGLNNVMIVVRHYPLSSRCNPKVINNTHPYACPAAKAVEAAGVVGGEEAFWKYHQLLHERQADLDQAPYLQIAKQMGLSEQSFTAAMRDPKVQDKIKRESKQLEAFGYHGIPAVFINGRYVDGWQVEGFMENIVREELKKAGITPPATSPTTLPTTQTSEQ